MNVTVRADFGASWYAARGSGAPAAPERPRLTYDLDVDVCVIGGGLAGLTVTREIARRGWSVALIEARRIAGAASGRNCGFVLPGFGGNVRQMVERIGISRARELWQLSEAGVEYVRATIRDTEMPGVAPVGGWLDVSKVDNGDELLAIATQLLEFGAAIEGWLTEQVRAVLGSERYFHAIHYPTAFHIDPLAYAYGLADAALKAGAAIFEETPALAIDPAGVRKRVTTPSGRVRAAHIVLCGNVELGGLIPGLAETVLPVTGYVAVTAPLGERLGTAIAYRGAVSDTRLANFHYRVVDRDRLMWAGDAGFWPRGPQAAARRFATAITETFPQLGAVEIEHAWSGVMGFSLHGMPQVGEVVPGLWLAGAFGAHGLNTSAMAGDLIARAITEHDDRWRLFLPYELVWAGGALGRLVRHLGTWSYGRHEEWVANLARRREAERRVEEEPQLERAERAPASAEATLAPAEIVSTQITEPAARDHVAVAAPPTVKLVDPPSVPVYAPDAAPIGTEPAIPAAAAALVPQIESLLHEAATRGQKSRRNRPRPTKRPKGPVGEGGPGPVAADPPQPEIHPVAPNPQDHHK